MKIRLSQIACARSGDKGGNSNIGLIFKNEIIYNWACKKITADLIKYHFKKICKGNVVRYELPNLRAFNFILEDSLGGGGSGSLLNDAQGKTHGQGILLLEMEAPDSFKEFINE